LLNLHLAVAGANPDFGLDSRPAQKGVNHPGGIVMDR
jgi:hypothetical protein